MAKNKKNRQKPQQQQQKLTPKQQIVRRNRQTPWGGCTDANPKLLLNDT